MEWGWEHITIYLLSLLKHKYQILVDHLQIPPGELAVQRGTRVEATDGYIGHD